MADFSTAYNTYVKPIEGGYVNNPNDTGGETYAGITRKNFPNWKGWPFIDKVKAERGVIKWNAKFKELDPLVTEFYLVEQWNRNNFGKINSQKIANILFDWFVNSGYLAVNTKAPETYGVDEILNRDFGFKLLPDSRFDTLTINAINSVNQDRLYNIIIKERENFYRTIVSKNPSQIEFLAGWLKRLSQFQPVALVSGLGVLVLGIVLIFVLTKK